MKRAVRTGATSPRESGNLEGIAVTKDVTIREYNSREILYLVINQKKKKKKNRRRMKYYSLCSVLRWRLSGRNKRGPAGEWGERIGEQGERENVKQTRWLPNRLLRKKPYAEDAVWAARSVSV